MWLACRTVPFPRMLTGCTAGYLDHPSPGCSGVPEEIQKGLSGDLKDVLRLHIQGEGCPSLIPEGTWHSSQLSSGLKEAARLAVL